MSRFAKFSVHCAVLVLLTSISGCGGGPNDAPDLAKAEGTVLVDDKPIEGALVTFVVAGKPIANGTTNASGVFHITTGGRPGAPVGSATVGISKPAPQPEGMGADATPEDMERAINQGIDLGAPTPDSEIPEKYADPSNSGLVATVDADASKNVYEFRLNK